MAVAWITYLDLDEVRKWSAPYRAECFDWRWQRWRVGFDGPIYEGWHLEQCHKPTLSLLSLSSIHDYVTDDKQPALPVGNAREALWVALREGAFAAIGIDSQSGRHVARYRRWIWPSWCRWRQGTRRTRCDAGFSATAHGSPVPVMMRASIARSRSVTLEPGRQRILCGRQEEAEAFRSRGSQVARFARRSRPWPTPAGTTLQHMPMRRAGLTGSFMATSARKCEARQVAETSPRGMESAIAALPALVSRNKD